MDLIFMLYSQYHWLYFFLLGLFSLLVGSFLNVLIHRLPIMQERSWQQEYQDYFSSNDSSTVSAERYNLFLPRSACPHCGHKITASENIPLFSWLFLKGRCSSCHQPISARYPLVELLCALASIAVALYYPPSWALAGALLLTWVLLALTFIDLDKLLLPDQLTLPLLWIGLLLNLSQQFVPLADAVIGAIAGYMVLWSLYWAFKLLTGKEGMGYGDFKLLAALGAWLGWQSLPLILILSSCVGAVLGITLIVMKQQQQGKPMPFGPYLAIAGWIALLWGNQITNWYLGLIG
ncbi:A24 family peptidase [uncultured Tolumonas sp.]|uniref:prepilin peptidase n=1 Tax=uncultured Tolumonas sp. TaxID=263765 RepID=UPI00292DF893|nr:A24 family peptidase [uncultured Tolumonas sp.]